MTDAKFTISSTVDLKKVAKQMRANVTMVLANTAPRMEADAKENYPWGHPYSVGYTPTGHAADSIKVEYDENKTGWIITASGNTSYFPFLELGMGKKYAILKPTVDKFTPELLNDIARATK